MALYINNYNLLVVIYYIHSRPRPL